MENIITSQVKIEGTMLNGELSGVTCYMPTRTLPPGVHDEAVACFLNQDYPGPKELIIYNNDPTIDLVFNHPEVIVINTVRRERQLGQIFNDTIALGKYPLVANWEDDDIRLPHHLSTMVWVLGSSSLARLKWYWFYNQGKPLEWTDNCYAHSGWLFRRNIFEKIGGYPSDNSFDADFFLIRKFWENGGASVFDCTKEQSTLIYRWDLGGHCHLSGLNYLKREEVFDKSIEVMAKHQAFDGNIKGRYEIKPKFMLDYEQMTRS